MTLVAILKVAGLMKLLTTYMLKINLEIQGTSSLQGVSKQNQDTAIGHIIIELLYQLRVCFFSIEFNYEEIFQGYKEHNVAQKDGVHNLAAVDSNTCTNEITR
jgi:hypothetical protein